MRTHTHILYDPTPGDITEAIAAATTEANRRCRTRLLPDDPAKARKLARECGQSAEGLGQLRGGRGGVPASQVVVAWWTDHIGRKHVVVRGRRFSDLVERPLLHPDVLAKRPPLWHCYPDRLVRRTASDGEHWLAACGCGNIGTPETLGWMGDVCGPCHDRREEYGPAILSAQPPGLLPGDLQSVTAVAFRPDGLAVIGMERDGLLAVWNLADASNPIRLHQRNISVPAAVALTGDGQYLVTAGISPFVYGEHAAPRPAATALAYDLNADPPVETPITAGHTFGVVAGPDPDTVTLSLDSGFAVVRPRIEHPVARLVRGLSFANSWMSPPHPAADGRHVVAVRPGVVTVFDAGTGRQVAAVPFSPELHTVNAAVEQYRAAYLPAGGWLFVAANDLIQSFDAASSRVRARVRVRGSVRHLAVDPAGKFLLAVLADGPVLAFALNLTVLASFAWHINGVLDAVLSPDGSTLATTGIKGGVKLWPIRRLLDG